MDLTFDRILSIGINYVGTRSELNGCINDVINVNKQCIAKESCVTMTELSHDKSLIPLGKNILAQIEKFVAGVKPGQRLLFQYSGHGSYERDTTGEETDGRDEVICPLDYQRGCISDDVLRAKLVEPLPAGVKLFCIFDCCHSGTILDLGYNYVIYPRGNKRKYVTRKEPKLNDVACDVICISGCMDPQTSADAYISGKYQGAMTWGFLTSIAQLEKNKEKITYHNLMKNLLFLMQKRRYSQVPQISTGKPLNLDSLME